MAVLETVPKSKSMQSTSKNPFRLSVSAANFRHQFRSLFFGEDIRSSKLKEIVYDTLQFDCPIVKVTGNIYSLELFHGPTLAFKDVGARFIAQLFFG